MSKRLYDPPLAPPDGAPTEVLAWYCEYVRTCLLLELLAEDVFTDQDAFDAWVARQMRLVTANPTHGGGAP